MTEHAPDARPSPTDAQTGNAPSEPAAPAAPAAPAGSDSLAAPCGGSVSPAVPAYAELARIIVGAQPLAAVLRRIAELAREIIPGADEASVTLIEGNRPRTVGFAGDLAATLDERQYISDRGPCIDAAVTGQTITIDDTALDTLYPEFSRQAHRHGIRHTLSVGMPALRETSGALNIYGRSGEGPFDDEACDIAAGFACYAGVALVNAALYAGAVQEVAQMREAMASRAVIEQAKGIIIRDNCCNADEAFDILRETSSRAHRKLRDVAQSMVDGASDLSTSAA